MKSIIITIGDELLIGQVVNTNASFIAEQLNSVGVEVSLMLSIADDEQEILTTLQEAYQKFDVIIVTGGLGPTHDDVTRSAVCKLFNTELVASEEARTYVEQFLRRHQRPWSEAAENQVLIPRGATVIPNTHGTAPGEFFEQENHYIFVMPGVPYEMQSMIDNFVIPYFKNKRTDRVILHRTLNTTGIPESQLALRLGSLDELLGDAKLAFLPSLTGVRLRISLIGTDLALCESRMKQIELQIRIKAGKYIFGVENETLEESVGKLLTERKLKISVAESCTGGMIAHRITNVPGSSKYFERGVVVYSNESKTDLLHVSPEMLAQHGAVSGVVAEAMARGIRTVSSTNIGISTTGIAGPSGGTEEKPVGLVWIGYSDINETIALKFQMGESRTRIKERASQAALDIVRKKILKID